MGLWSRGSVFQVLFSGWDSSGVCAELEVNWNQLQIVFISESAHMCKRLRATSGIGELSERNRKRLSFSWQSQVNELGIWYTQLNCTLDEVHDGFSNFQKACQTEPARQQSESKCPTAQIPVSRACAGHPLHLAHSVAPAPSPQSIVNNLHTSQVKSRRTTAPACSRSSGVILLKLAGEQRPGSDDYTSLPDMNKPCHFPLPIRDAALVYAVAIIREASFETVVKE